LRADATQLAKLGKAGRKLTGKIVLLSGVMKWHLGFASGEHVQRTFVFAVVAADGSSSLLSWMARSDGSTYLGPEDNLVQLVPGPDAAGDLLFLTPTRIGSNGSMAFRRDHSAIVPQTNPAPKPPGN
jgi:hypothetical protein